MTEPRRSPNANALTDRPRLTARLMSFLSVLLVGGLVLAGGASSAHAAPKTIGGFVGGPASAANLVGGTYIQPRDVAVYTGGDADTSNDKIFVAQSFSVVPGFDPNRIDRLDRDGNWERAWGRDVIKSGATGDTGTSFEVCTVAADCKQGLIGGLKGEFTAPSGLAIDQANGWVYVLDRSNFRVQKFDLDGAFISTFGRDVNQTAIAAAAPQAQRDVCTQASSDVCKAGVAGTGAGQLGSIGTTTTTAALYPKLDVNPVTHDVFVVDPGNGAAGNRRVLQFDSSGAFLRGWGYGVDTGAAQFQTCTTASTCQAGNAAGTANGQFANNPQHIAVGADGVVYVSDANAGAASNRIVRFDASLAPAEPGPPFPDASAALLAPLTAGAPMPDAATLGLEIDRSSGNLLVTRDPSASGSTVVQELSTPAASSPAIADTHVFALDTATNNGLGYNPTTGIIYLTFNGTCSACGGPGLFLLATGGGATPAVTIAPPSVVGSTTATLAGTVTANGSAKYHFELSKDGVTFTPVGTDVYVSGTGAVPVSAAVTGLSPNTTYRVKLVASKVTGLTTTASATSAEGTVVTDAVAPVAATLPATGQRTTSATLQATVNPSGSSTTYRFEYGTTTGYGRTAPVPSGNAGAGTADLQLSESVTGLQPDTLYHYRIVATNTVGTSAGSDRTFRTRAEVAAPAGRAYELVSEPDKASGPGVGSHGNHSLFDGELGMYVGFPSDDGERFLTAGLDGPILTGDAASVYVKNYYLAQRCAAPTDTSAVAPGCANLPVGGWANRAVANRPNYGSSTVTPFLDVSDVHRGLSWMTFDNSGGISMLFPEQASWAPARPQYLRSWEGDWKLLAPLDDSHGLLNAGKFVSRFAADGSSMTLSTEAVGLLGSGNPSADLIGGGASVYRVDLASGVADDFSDRGPSELVSVCTGAGAERTAIPAVAAGKLAAQACPDPLAGRYAAPTNVRGSSLPLGPLPSTDSRRNVISADGSRIFFLSPDPNAVGALSVCAGTGSATACPPQLYVWQRGATGSPTVRWISRSAVANQDASLLGSAGVRYEGASTDGDKVFFRTNAPLTEDDPNGGLQVAGGVTSGSAGTTSWDLYMYDLPDAPGADPGAGSLTRISAGPTSGADANVSRDGDSAALRFASADGERVYFTTAAPLPGVSAPTDGTTTTPGGTSTTSDTVNLYLYDASEPLAQRWRFVARLPRGNPSASGADINACATTAGPEGGVRASSNVVAIGLTATANNCVQGTADGKFVTFWTLGQLVAGDPDAASGDMYAFDASRDELTRLSASQGGAGGSYTCLTAGSIQCHGDPGFSQLGKDRVRLQVAPKPETPGDRIAVFESRSRLTPDDGDDHMDVYEWRNGDLSLISRGVDDMGAYESGMSETGRDIFFKTAANLTWQDIDAVADIYDAREGGGFTEPVTPPVCDVLAGACHTAIAATEMTSSSETSRIEAQADAPNIRGHVVFKKLTAAQRANLARGGRAKLFVSVNKPGKVTVSGRASWRKIRRRVLSSSRTASRAGRIGMPLRLSRAAAKALRRGEALRVTLSVAFSGAREPVVGSISLDPDKPAARRRPSQSKREGSLD